ncbi:hypothetical protein LMJF_26_0770 [Leishmania major strain Friedlin]|uniref:Uncharacterized protein n=1 Tax=Leishmania major TaxID=5664 RepID=Q4Q9B7_LEIMA|nr:hypothetical protein LMJF_26_0770 [Leishmania major strain Friedlin]CAG9576380.1 hypothetical_protein_-_conserved [Leishmania major strain Friedlin]CAJ04900.1 hypothetical protein LMJF_26_0770 [Leishmania major strain Friedlin]|eukprot:XP_001684081.1 hypothetical protein LMJF_26_0770 [Leishmania major strain Friedlin]
MDSSHFKRVHYDLPQEQLEYFGSRARTSPSFVPSTPVRIVCDKATLGCNHEMLRRSQERPENAKNELHAVTQLGSLAEKYHQYFAQHLQADIESPWLKTDSAVSGFHPVKESQRHETPAPRTTAQKPASESPSHVSSVQRAHPPVRANSSLQPRFHGSIPQEQSASIIDHATWHMTQSTENYPLLSRNHYEQPQGEHAPVSKLSASCDSPVSRDLPIGMSTSARSQHEESAVPQQTRERPSEACSYMPQQVDTIHPVLKAQDHQESNYLARRPASQGHLDEYERMCDDEENCTFHPKVNNASWRRKMRMQRSTHRESERANSLCASRGDHEANVYDRMHGDADAVKRRSDSRRAQKEIDNTQVERNASHGSRSTFVNPHRSAVDSQAEPKEVFLRLYADAQRYNKEKAEQERLIELKRQQERGEAPYDRENGSKARDGSQGQDDGIGVSEDEKSLTAKPRGSSSRRKGSATRDLFERLSRPHTVTIKFEKQKEQAEQEKREKEQRNIEAKRSETEKITACSWRIPSKSFTFSDLESQNALYVS